MSASWAEPDTPRGVDALDAETLLRTLRDHNVEFVVIGGLAVAVHGYVRATKDVDVIPRPDPENRRRLYDALRTLDAEPVEVGDFRPEELPVPFAPEGLEEGGNWALRTRAGRIDVLQWVAGIGHYYELRERAVEVELPDVGPLLVAGYEDVLAMKRAAGRPVDLQDIAALEDVRRRRGE
jgi:hypothetical protein